MIVPDVNLLVYAYSRRAPLHAAARKWWEATLGEGTPVLFGGLGVAGNLTTDAHLAAIAMEHQCELLSNDTDFGRFPGLRWRDPLRKGR